MLFFWALWMVIFSFKHGSSDSRLFFWTSLVRVYTLHFNIVGNLRTKIFFSFKQLTVNWENELALLMSCNKLSQNGWLKTAKMNSLPVLKARSLKSIHWPESKVLAGPCSLWRLSQRTVPCLFQLWRLLSFFALWSHHANFCFCLLISFSSVYVTPSSASFL